MFNEYRVRAVALLFMTNIWVFSWDIGNKWIVFSSKGAKLIDALASPPSNNAGSIYINHNGIHKNTFLGCNKF